MTPDEWIAHLKSIAIHREEGMIEVPVEVWDKAVAVIERIIDIHSPQMSAGVIQCSGESHAFYPCHTITETARAMGL